MSLEFAVLASKRPVYRDVIRAVAVSGLVCAEDVGADEAWPDESLHFHRHGVSCREIGIGYAEGAFRIGVPAFAAAEDFDLAIRFAESFAEQCDSVIETEEGETLSPGRARDTLNDEWIRERIEAWTEKLFAMVRREQGCYQIPGPVRSFYIGPRVSSELTEGAPAEELSGRLAEAIRRVQYAYEDTHFAVSVMALRVKGTDGEVTASAWGEGVAHLFAPVDFLVVGGDRSLFVPYESLPEVAGDRLSWLDERQALVEAAEGEDWKGILQRAERHAAPPAPEAPDR